MDVGLGAGAQHNEAIEGRKIFRPEITELPQAAPRWWPGYRRQSELLAKILIYPQSPKIPHNFSITRAPFEKFLMLTLIVKSAFRLSLS